MFIVMLGVYRTTAERSHCDFAALCYVAASRKQPFPEICQAIPGSKEISILKAEGDGGGGLRAGERTLVALFRILRGGKTLYGLNSTPLRPTQIKLNQDCSVGPGGNDFNA